MIKNVPNEKSRDFCLMFMNSMEDGRENPGSRPWTFKTWKNQGSRPWTFDDYEYQLCTGCLVLDVLFWLPGLAVIVCHNGIL
jgi:hypothetical protein